MSTPHATYGAFEPPVNPTRAVASALTVYVGMPKRPKKLVANVNELWRCTPAAALGMVFTSDAVTGHKLSGGFMHWLALGVGQLWPAAKISDWVVSAFPAAPGFPSVPTYSATASVVG